jgi:hypothetical protein
VIVGWSIADHMRTELVTDALGMAIIRRRPEKERADGRTVLHSDSEYVEAGVPGRSDPHSDGRDRMLVPGRSRAS